MFVAMIHKQIGEYSKSYLKTQLKEWINKGMDGWDGLKDWLVDGWKEGRKDGMNRLMEGRMRLM